MKKKLLFLGDSVTDAGRDFADGYDLGQGYVKYIADSLKTEDVTVLNRGVSANRVADLHRRIDTDAIEFTPDVVTILIGINDTWFSFSRWEDTSVTAFKEVYRVILTRIKVETNAEIVLMEPFVLPYPEDRKAWRGDLDPKIGAVRELAAEFGATLIPLDGLMNALAVKHGPTYLAEDGVHPTKAGHEAIASIWLEFTK
ncbi:SGNH/GDSL hydrolase family protein [Listeria seeligeri]|uniref:SGNH/GDSL hydrolase family protein n=2 Tax=Listeria TaxID=1637 RepID=A0A7X0X1W7_LISSE|nr:MULTISPECIES: SGNH/GDSL hydrolase family protein [Listeria]AHI55000.1 GDSL family lipase [Listeria ivanovii WSLC3009]AIS64456.1 GDSL family lipase [Listeria ivanovii subsp. ivanovii]MBC1486096.1 SGNH/GDSL hydrolase family protein [Listeria seeligeri]MBC1723043.1 SGNH/GDSL hydrolase family protein [Listeria seeligeri]MBC1758873.1 SGNH/GDSL hydrolase family protein [Listeria ivanovii]